MAKGNYGVNSLGNGTGTRGSGNSASLSGKGISNISKTIANSGFLPDIFERGASTGSAKKQTNSIANIATRDKSSENNIATAFRESKKKQ